VAQGGGGLGVREEVALGQLEKAAVTQQGRRRTVSLSQDLGGRAAQLDAFFTMSL
jgi:hypothetical protein